MLPATVERGICVAVEVIPQQDWLFKDLSTVWGIADVTPERLSAFTGFQMVLQEFVSFELSATVGAGWRWRWFGAKSFLLTGDAMKKHVQGCFKLFCAIPTCGLFTFPTDGFMLHQPRDF